ncbi:uncharacterized protein F5891DRAFT_1180254 [Suillus fuscotomentosus]|uniref:Uncharacterized protein n=1 Tax=Suillus fuscotomentosus TaxID=1912939 RepID=A0AAD4EMC5_9AGAM|nr:uncharacterized protein F5891DRAFT_1180254 [Suillus fuscotomentosus]KAG1908716.1 hypothetical protein F5891DRAFT_1180254 [Suillus fuscotomentosus]
MSAPPISLNLSNDIPSSSSRLMPCTRTHPVQQCPSCHSCRHDSSGISDLYDIANGIGSMSINDTNELEANLVMDLARVRRDIFRAEKVLADCVVREREIMANLSKHQSDVSKKKLDKADIGLGLQEQSNRHVSVILD